MLCLISIFYFLFEGVSFKLTSSWPPARGRGVASCGPDATSAGSGGEFREARFYAQARANRHICSELGVQFSKNPRKSPWAPQGTPRQPQGPQGTPEGPPRDLRGSPGGLHGAPKGPKGSPKGAKWAPNSSQRHPKASPRATKTSQEDKLYQQTPDQPPARPLC